MPTLSACSPLAGVQRAPTPARTLSRRVPRPSRLQCAAQGPSPDEGPSTSGRDALAPAPRRPPAFPFAPIAALAGAGALETGYLTLTKLAGGAVACPLSGGCADVLASPFASLWGVVPLSAAGALAYAGVAAAAAAGARAAAAGEPDGEALLRSAVAAGATLLATTSAYLMYVLFNAFPGEMCPWCLGSAGLSAGIAALALGTLPRRELEEGAAPGAGLAAATLLALTLGLGTPTASEAGTGVTELEYKQPVVTTEGPGEAPALAAALKAAGAKMYGAFWCSHCYEQKQIFGKAAMEAFPYVECFPEGWRQGLEMAPACKAADLNGFPTWVIGSARLEGAQELDTLREALEAARAEATAAAAQ